MSGDLQEHSPEAVLFAVVLYEMMQLYHCLPIATCLRELILKSHPSKERFRIPNQNEFGFGSVQRPDLGSFGLGHRGGERVVCRSPDCSRCPIVGWVERSTNQEVDEEVGPCESQKP